MPDDAAIAQLRSELLLRLTELSGDVRLILQRMDQMDTRAQEHGNALAALDGRVDAVERTTVTRQELDRRDEQVRAKTTQRLTVIGLIITVVNILIGSGIAVAAIIVK